MVPIAEIASAFVSILPSARGFGRKLESDVSGEVNGSGKKLGSGFGKAFAVGGAAFAAAGVGQFLRGAISGSAELEQSVGAIDTVFKGSADQMHQWSKGAAQSVGLTANEFNELGTLIGTQLRNGGTAMDELAPKTNNLITLGADLSSMFGGTTKDAVAALSSALKGERDPIEAYGVSLTQAKLDAEAAALGFEKVGGALSAEAQQAATLSLIMKQTADAQGNFAKESGTLAGQQQRLSAQFENIKTTVGAALLPALTSLATTVNSSILPAFSSFIAGMREGTGIGGQVAAVFGTIADNIGTIVPVLGTLVGGLVTYRVASLAAAAATAIQAAGITAATGATWSLNTALRANPIGIVVTALTALAVGLVIAYKRSETFRNIVNAMWAALKVAIGWVVNITGKIAAFAARLIGPAASAVRSLAGVLAGALVAALRSAITFVANAIGALVRFGAALGQAVEAAARFARGVIGKVGEALAYIKAIPGRVTGALSGLGSLLYSKGAELIDGLIDGITSKIDDVGSAIGGVASKIRGFLPGSPVKEGPLKSWNRGGAGKRLMDVLARGIADNGKLPVKRLRANLEAMQDTLRAKIKDIRQDFTSLRDSVAQAFTTDLTAATNGYNFARDLRDNILNLQAVKAAFAKLQGKLPASFLSELLQSGNSGLIVDLAGATRGELNQIRSNLATQERLAGSLGNQVARNEYGRQTDRLVNRLERVERAIDRVGPAVGKAVNSGASTGRRDRKK